MEQFQAKSREYKGKYILGIYNKILLANSKINIGLNIPTETELKVENNHELLILNNIFYDGYEIKQYENAKI
ncbi:hypothetical protein ABTD96_19765, partial [Acinetobacter baumannii]